MKEVKFMKRNVLTEAINNKRDVLEDDLFMVNSVRATANGSLQIEVCQNRNLSGAAESMLSLLNIDDERFSANGTLLYDWIKIMPKNFLTMYPEVDITLEQLEEIIESYDPDAPRGADALVVALLDEVTNVIHPRSGKKLTPIIVVSEYVEADLVGELFNDDDAEEKAANIIKQGKAVMKTSSAPNAEYIVHPQTGEKIYRFTRTYFKEEGKEDVIIAGKVTESQFKRRKSEYTTNKKASFKESIVGEDNL
jgi:hypothetical protein